MTYGPTKNWKQLFHTTVKDGKPNIRIFLSICLGCLLLTVVWFSYCSTSTSSAEFTTVGRVSENKLFSSLKVKKGDKYAHSSIATNLDPGNIERSYESFEIIEDELDKNVVHKEHDEIVIDNDVTEVNVQELRDKNNNKVTDEIEKTEIDNIDNLGTGAYTKLHQEQRKLTVGDSSITAKENEREKNEAINLEKKIIKTESFEKNAHEIEEPTNDLDEKHATLNNDKENTDNEKQEAVKEKVTENPKDIKDIKETNEEEELTSTITIEEVTEEFDDEEEYEVEKNRTSLGDALGVRIIDWNDPRLDIMHMVSYYSSDNELI